jgi:hypothetical protein
MVVDGIDYDRLPSSSQPPPQRAQSFRDDGNAHVSTRPYGSLSSGNSYRNPVPPPPPPPPESQRYGSWNQSQYNSQRCAGFKGSPAPSEGSNHTMVGSDFEPEKPNGDHSEDAPPDLSRSDSSFSRKRSYEDADNSEEKPRQQDDYTKRKRRSQVDAAYR